MGILAPTRVRIDRETLEMLMCPPPIPAGLLDARDRFGLPLVWGMLSDS